MNLKILLPFQIFAQKSGVLRINAESQTGWFGLLPHRLDCIVSLVPGILIYETETEGEQVVAVDAGILLKIGADVQVSVSRAFGGMALAQLRERVAQEFLSPDSQAQEVRAVMAKLESGLIHSFIRLQHE